jgi:hypothetical protein
MRDFYLTAPPITQATAAASRPRLTAAAGDW